MWVFDGEQWTTEDGADEQPKKAEIEMIRIEEYFAELQVVEVVKPQRGQIPPPPM
jgi:hypothetical protein